MLKCNFRKYLVITFILSVLSLTIGYVMQDVEKVITLIMMSSIVLFTLCGAHLIVLFIRLFHDGPSETNMILNSIIFIAPFKKSEIFSLSIMFMIFGILVTVLGRYIIMLK